jgi:transposase-like protein
VSQSKARPTNLLQAIQYFSDLDVATDFVAQLKWPDGPFCPKCGCTEYSYLKTRRVWKCKACKKQYSVKLGTIFEDSPLGLDKWLPAVWLTANSKNGISSHELGRSLGITQKSAWFMLHRIRLAMQTGTFEKINGQVEADETFVGGRSENMHKDVRKRKITGTGGKDKAIVGAVLERDGQVRAEVLPDRNTDTLHALVEKHVVPGSDLYTDLHSGYNRLSWSYRHGRIDHAVEYVNGPIHVNGVENFWSLLKRGLKGTYVSVAPKHLFRYVDERAFTLQPARVERLRAL